MIRSDSKSTPTAARFRLQSGQIAIGFRLEFDGIMAAIGAAIAAVISTVSGRIPVVILRNLYFLLNLLL